MAERDDRHDAMVSAIVRDLNGRVTVNEVIDKANEVAEQFAALDPAQRARLLVLLGLDADGPSCR
jgi:hypothetical protein